MKRNVALFIAMSLDGYIADSEGSVDWLESFGEGDTKDTSYEAFYRDVDTVIMGRATYDQVVQELSPDVYPYEGITSYVLTHETRTSTDTIRFVDENVVSLIDRLVDEVGGKIWIVGGTSVVTPLIETDRIDSFVIAIAPLVLGSGIRLFESQPNRHTYTLKKSEKINQFTYLHFECNR